MVFACENRRALLRAKQGFHTGDKLLVCLLPTDQLFLKNGHRAADPAPSRGSTHRNEKVVLRSALLRDCSRQLVPGLSVP